MKWKNSKELSQSEIEKTAKDLDNWKLYLVNWHDCFAWTPTKVRDHTVWLETIQRRLKREWWDYKDAWNFKIIWFKNSLPYRTTCTLGNPTEHTFTKPTKHDWEYRLRPKGGGAFKD